MSNLIPKDKSILVVDDEEIVRVVTAMMLEELGVVALQAKGGQEAVDILQAEPTGVAVVLLDFSMPGMNGYETLLKLFEINPQVKIIMTSGLSVIPEVQELRDKGEIDFLLKPYSEEQLVASIRKVMA